MAREYHPFFAPPDSPCVGCGERSFFSFAFGMLIGGRDCPYVCRAWDEYAAEAGLELQRPGEERELNFTRYSDFTDCSACTERNLSR